MTLEIVGIVIAMIAVLVSIASTVIYVRKTERRIETNHLEGLKKEFVRVRQEMQGLETALRTEISGVGKKLDKHIQWHLDHPNPGGGMETT